MTPRTELLAARQAVLRADVLGDLERVRVLAALRSPRRPGRLLGRGGAVGEDDEGAEACADYRGEEDVDDPEAEAIGRAPRPVATLVAAPC